MNLKHNTVHNFQSFLINCVLMLSSVLLFAFCQPNIFSLNGFPFLAYIAFLPFFLLLRRISFKASFLWGAVFGCLSYCVFTYWLAVFHPLAMYVIAILYFCYYLLAVPLLKLADMLFPKKGYIVQWLVYLGYEYLKTLGFNGYSYGVIGYSQWSYPVIIQIASIFGVWGVSALITFPSAWLSATMKDSCTGPIKTWLSSFQKTACKNKISAFIWLAAMIATIAFGLTVQKDYSSYPKFTLALIQPNSDPWQGGLPAYRRDFNTLSRLSTEALAKHPDIQLVVWPETAFIPRIDWHYRYREDSESFELVSNLLQYLNTAPVPFVLGNDDAVKETSDEGILERVDYNAVFLFTPQKNVIPPRPERYRKQHLVPFTEHFPYRKMFPWVYDILVETDTHFWEKGEDSKVFSVDSLSFSTPICFEDTFGYISRRFVNNGARAIVNLTNDAWSKSAPSQYQHLSMAVFRAVENRVPLVRSTASGQTAFVDPNGIITSMLPPFEPAYLVGSIPILEDVEKTLYRQWGDLWGVLFVVFATLLLLYGLLTKLRNMYEN